MTKTPEELAEEYAVITTNNLFYREPLSNAFLAGYKAAQEHAHAALEEAEAEIDRLQTKLSDTGILATDHIVDASKMVDVSSSATLNNWISVRTRLPDRNTNVLAWIKCGTSEYVFIETASGDPSECSGWKHYNKEQVTHWMPLPAAPKDGIL
jgi:hypothetical protein